MSVEHDILSGLDITSLDEVDQSQLLQMFNQAVPLINRGLIIYMSGAAGATPDIANNPRFARYIWLDSQTDPPTPKIRNVGGGTWDSLAVAAGSITNTQVNAAAAIAITKLAFGTARYIVRTNLAADALEFVNPNAIFANNDVPLTAINITAAPPGVKSYLQRDAVGGTTTFQPIAFADFGAGDLLSIAKINPSGSNNQVIATMAGSVIWDEIQDILADFSLPINKLVSGTALQVLRRNAANTANEWGSIPFSREAVVDDSQALSVSLPEGGANVRDIAHGLGTKPRLVIGVLRCITDDIGYVAADGDEIPIYQLLDNSVADPAGRAAIGVWWNATNVRFMAYNIAAGLRITHNKGSGASAAITQANWRLKFYAYV